MKFSDYLWIWVLLFVIETDNSETDPCSTAVNISDVRRHSTYSTSVTDVDLCDDNLNFSSWFTFGDKLTSHCVELNKCGTVSGIWLDGRHPVGEEIQTVDACSGYSIGDCCTWKHKVLIKKCQKSFVYKLWEVSQCPMAYCVGDSIDAFDHLPNTKTQSVENKDGKKTFQRVVLECPQFGKRKLGFTIVGGLDSPKGAMGIYIKTISTDGLAYESGQLLKGDEIVAINGASLRNLTHSEALSTIKANKSKFPIRFFIARRKLFRRQTSLPSFIFESISTIPEEPTASDQATEDTIDTSNLSLNSLAEDIYLANEKLEKDKVNFKIQSVSDFRDVHGNSGSTEQKYSQATQDTKRDAKNVNEDFNFKNDIPIEMDKPLCVIPHKFDTNVNSSPFFSKSVEVIEKLGKTQECQITTWQDLTKTVHDSTNVAGTNLLGNIWQSLCGQKIMSFGSKIYKKVDEKKEPQLSEENAEHLSESETSDEGIAMSNSGPKLKETERAEFTSGSDVFDDSFDSTSSPKKVGIEFDILQNKINLVTSSESGSDFFSLETEESHARHDRAVNNNDDDDDDDDDDNNNHDNNSNSNNNNNNSNNNINSSSTSNGNVEKLKTASQLLSETIDAKPESQNRREILCEKEDSHRDSGLFKVFHFNEIHFCPFNNEISSATTIERCASEVAKYDSSRLIMIPVEVTNDLHISATNRSPCAATYDLQNSVNNKHFTKGTKMKDHYTINQHLDNILIDRTCIDDMLKENSLGKRSNLHMHKSILASRKEPIFLDSKTTVRSDLLEKYRRRHEWNERTFKALHSRLSKSSSSLNWTSDLLVNR